MEKEDLGRLSRVELREIWASESSDFTPWLAQEDNLAILGETLGIDLEFEAQEKAVGPFRADILCRDIGSGAWVLIENQLEQTDHRHLGQLLTYAAGLEAAIIIWVAADFNEEHRSTLDWLNKITDEQFRFFGLEVELWRIGNSPAAPKFNVVSKPNDWSRSVARGRQSLDQGELSPIRALQLEYWKALNIVLEEAEGPVSGERKPQAQPWMSFAIGRSGFHLGAVMVRKHSHVQAELYLSGTRASTFFHQLHEQKDVVEAELGYELDWEELPTGAARIAIRLNDTDPEDQEDWPRQHQWLATKLNEFHRVFVGRVRNLDATGTSADE